ncbi:threonine aldolase family protein [Zhouia amylolytica]|uniref:Aromatic amino acid beta-eliminating lyase/threonine aldolase domain-containing protein n=1 Tax=Zhouia amylolytica AD3 TaxID=1286632 RepID=W2UQ88_9FLAO|nr:beta-eliminating lyase-related protein [Zhouia amylolytica]ETN95482.1 hypothetical protein P278_12040 [Zhouia amylolytica AD3]
MNNENKRRNFLKQCGLTAVPLMIPGIGMSALPFETGAKNQPTNNPTAVNFIFDGLSLDPKQYLEKLTTISNIHPIEPDFYGNGGATKALEEEFARLTGKEKAIYLPTGTMANQLAIKLLNGTNTKAMVPENSHVFRDEADAAQSVHGKRLIPVGNGQSTFSLEDLKTKISYLEHEEVFKSGLGTVVIENPVRRADGRIVPIEAIKEIASYCKQQGYKMHLDGARLHIAAAYTGVSIAEYAAQFDTVYISLYKYLNASGGAILCGDAAVIDQVSHQVKILGGTVFQSWNQTAMALHYLKGIEERWQQVIKSTQSLITELNTIDGVNISSLDKGTNIYDLRLREDINLKDLAMYLYNEHNIWLGRANDQGIVKFTVNESLLTRNLNDIVNAWKKGVKSVRKEG